MKIPGISIPSASIRWLVGNMHVATPYWDVARDIYKRCRKAGNVPRAPQGVHQVGFAVSQDKP
jgi:hypothetical protein